MVPAGLPELKSDTDVDYMRSNLQLDIIDKKFKGTNFIYTLKTKSKNNISVFVHSHHVHQHQINDKFGIKKPIHIKHLVCF